MTAMITTNQPFIQPTRASLKNAIIDMFGVAFHEQLLETHAKCVFTNDCVYEFCFYLLSLVTSGRLYLARNDGKKRFFVARKFLAGENFAADQAIQGVRYFIPLLEQVYGQELQMPETHKEVVMGVVNEQNGIHQGSKEEFLWFSEIY